MPQQQQAGNKQTSGTPTKIQPDAKAQQAIVPRAIAITAHTDDKISKIALLQVTTPDKPAAPAVELPAVAALTFTPGTVVGGQDAHGTVILAAKAPIGDTPVYLTINDSKTAQIPASPITVSAGQLPAEFTLHTSPVDRETPIVITATSGKASQTAAFVVKPPSLADVKATPNPDGTYTITTILNGKAGPQGVVVSFDSPNPYLQFNGAAKVAGGASNVPITVRQQPLPRNYFGASARVRVTVNNITKYVDVPLHR